MDLFTIIHVPLEIIFDSHALSSPKSAGLLRVLSILLSPCLSGMLFLPHIMLW